MKYHEIKQIEHYNYISIFKNTYSECIAVRDFSDLFIEHYKTNCIEQKGYKNDVTSITNVLYTEDNETCIGLPRSKKLAKRWTGLMFFDLDLDKQLKEIYKTNSNAELNKSVNNIITYLHSIFTEKRITTKTSVSGTGLHIFLIFDVMEWSDEQTLEYYTIIFDYTSNFIQTIIDKAINKLIEYNILTSNFLVNKFSIDTAHRNYNQPISLSNTNYISRIYNNPIQEINDVHINNIVAQHIHTNLTQYTSKQIETVLESKDINIVKQTANVFINSIFKRLDGHLDRLKVISALKYLGYDISIIDSIRKFDFKTKRSEYINIYDAIDTKNIKKGIIVDALNLLKNCSVSNKKLPKI